MNLEDHLGDILSKARQAMGISPEAAAKAAGLSSKEFQQLEATGLPPKPLNYGALAALTGLDAAKLERIAQNWLPKVPDLSQWREVRRITTSAQGMDVHCYLIWDEVTREAALFDTGWEAEPIIPLIDENQLQLRHIFITHTHSDHVAGLPGVRDRFPKARLHSSARSAPLDQRNRPTDFIHLGSLRITNRDTPGHAEDGMTYLIGNFPDDAPNVAVVGDAIFAGSMGRGNQSWELAKQKVRDQIFTLPPDTLVCPGHGPLTTVGQEKTNNPFFP